jgi:hypothetical protein
MTNFQTMINTFFGNLFNIATGVALAVSIVCIAWGGFRLMTSGGNIRQAESAKATLVAALAGLFIVLTANLLAGLVQGAIP